MLSSHHYWIILPGITLFLTLASMDDPTESFLNKTTLTYRALIKATKQGDVPVVMHVIKKNPALLNCQDQDKNTLLVIASLNKRENLVKQLVRAGARINMLQSIEIWGMLAQTPQSDQAKRIVSFLQFTRSKGFLLYHKPLLAIQETNDTETSTSCIPKFMFWLFSAVRNAFLYVSVDSQHSVNDRILTVPHSAHMHYFNTVADDQSAPDLNLLYAATLDNNHSCIKHMLETIHVALKNTALSSAASIATRECNNHFLALYILFSRHSPLNDIFFNKITDAQ